jgi:hypothetical protein
MVEDVNRPPTSGEIAEIIESLRSMTSDAAASWIMSRYPIDRADWYVALLLIPKLSLKRPERAALADYYLKKLPFANARPYQMFVSILGVKRLIYVLRRHIPQDAGRRDLFEYYVFPTLRRAAKTPGEHELIDTFASELHSAQVRGSEPP